MTRRFINWARTHSAQCSLAMPKSTEEIQELVLRAAKSGQRLKAVGAGHSFNDVAMTSGTHLSLDRMTATLQVDRKKMRIRVQAGIRLKDLVEDLDVLGLALPNLGSIAEQSIAGAISTGTHGTGASFGSLSSLVTDFKLVDGHGHVLTSETLPLDAAALSLGALGVFTELELKVEEAFDLKEERWTMPVKEAIAAMPDLVAEHEHVKFWWLPHTESVVIFVANRTRESRTPPPSEALENFLNDKAFAGAIELGRLSPAAIPRINRVIAQSYFQPRTRVSRCDHIFNLAMPPVHLESEYGIEASHAPIFFQAIEDGIRRNKWNIGFIQEIRFVAEDQIWLSGAFGRPSCQFGVYATESRDTDAYFRYAADVAKDLDGRPHWGKSFLADHGELARVYPRLGEFAELRQKHDPQNVFLNDFLRRVLAV